MINYHTAKTVIEAKTYFTVTSCINEYIFRFQISVRHVQVMHIFKCENNLRCIEPGYRLTNQIKRKHIQFKNALLCYIVYD